MPEWSTLVLFIITTELFLLTPGPAVLTIVALSIDQGRLAGIVTVLGIGLGTLIHVVGAVLGASAVLVASPATFEVIKFLGAGYLVYLGIRKLLELKALEELVESEPQRLSQVFYQGFMVNLLNPQTALFVLAFLPQFVDPARGTVARQLLLLGLIFVVMAIISDSLYALLSSTIGHWLRGSRAFVRGQRLLAGSILVVLGITTVLFGS